LKKNDFADIQSKIRKCMLWSEKCVFLSKCFSKNDCNSEGDKQTQH